VSPAPALPAVRPCHAVEAGWLALRAALWPHVPARVHREEAEAIVAVALIAEVDGRVVGFAEAALRHEYVNGTHTSPVAFLEGLYVDRGHWRRGIARALVEAVERWARAGGCREVASDALLDNQSGILAHRALGFEETERVVFFRKEVGD
jgi:aminoglycoside 6'-N-acetyltransferase I